MPAPPRSRARAAAAVLALALAGLPGEAGACLRRPADPPGFPMAEPMRIAPLAAPGEEARGDLPGLLTTPPGWAPGDAAVVLLPARYPAERLHLRLAEALLAEGAALLEVDPDAARGLSPESAATAPEGAMAGEALLPDLLGALAALRRHPGAGLVAVIGLGEGGAGAAALAAVSDAAAARLPPGAGAGYAAAIALTERGAGFAPGAPPSAAEAWPLRAPLLCEAVAWAAAGEEPEAMRALAGRCAGALLHGTPRPAPTAAGGGAGADARQIAQGAR